MIPKLPFIFFCSIVFISCTSETATEASSSEEATPSAQMTISKTNTPPKESETMAWLASLKKNLELDYAKAKDIEEKIKTLKEYEEKMKTYLKSKNDVLDSVIVRVETIDSNMQSQLYVHLSNSYIDYATSYTLDDSASKKTVSNLIKNLHTGGTSTVHFSVETVKVNDPTSFLTPFEIEGRLMPHDSLK